MINKTATLILILLLWFLLVSCKKDNHIWTSSRRTFPDTPLYRGVPCQGNFLCFTENIFSSVAVSSNFLLLSGAFGAAAASEDNAFFGGGHEEGYIGFELSEVNVFNIKSGEWKLSHLSVPRSHLSAVYVDVKVIFAGGNNRYTCCPVYGLNLKYYNTVDIYDVAQDSWRYLVMPRKRGHAGAAVVGNRIYISGGMNDQGNLTVTDVFDVTTETWSELVTPHEHPFASSIALNDQVFVCGGDGLDNKSVDIFNTTSNSWSSYELSDSRYNIALASSGGKVIFLAGNFSNMVDLYDSGNKSWSATKLTLGVDGVSAASTSGSSYFVGFLFQNGYAILEAMIIVTP